MAVIRVTRTRHLVSMNHPFDIIIDGKKVCAIQRGKSADLTVRAGRREVLVKSSFVRSRPLVVDVVESGATNVEIGVKLNGWRLFVPPMYFWHYCIPGEFFYARETDQAEDVSRR